MKITELIRLNLKKLQTKRTQAAFLIIPVGVLMSIAVVLTSQIANIENALENSVFETISNQFQLIQLEVAQEEFNPSQFLNSQDSTEETRYSAADEVTITQIDGVDSANLSVGIPISNISTSNLYEDKEIDINQLYTLDSETAKLYTESDFNYSEDEAIPIIINTSSLVYQYEDWGDSDTVTFDMEDMRPDLSTMTSGERPTSRLSLVKEETIQTDKGDLIGKTFTIEFGGLDEIQDYTSTRNTEGVAFTKLTDEEYTAEVEEREATISEYWDYDQISTPISYTFKIVGVIEDSGSRTNYIPTNFADKLMTNYITNEITARTTEIDTDLLNSDFLGLSYDGDEISSDTRSLFGQIGRRFEGAAEEQMGSGMGPGGSVFSFENPTINGINIPGLIVLTDDKGNVEGVNEDGSVYAESNKYSENLNVLIEDAKDRSSIIEELNTLGYSFQDDNQLEVVDNLHSTLSTVSKVFMISFIALIGAIIVLTTSKFVSESVKEIGILRALGMKKSGVLFMFILRILLYVLIGYLIGLGVGLLANMVSAGLVASWFDSFVENTLSKQYSVVESVSSSTFFMINWAGLLVYSAILTSISIIIGLVPSIAASKTSPVEAIKSE